MEIVPFWKGNNNMATPITFVAPNSKLGELFLDVSRSFNKEISVIIGDLQDGVQLAQKLIDDGVDVIISRGGTALAIKEQLPDFPVVEVQVTAFDLLRAIQEGMKYTNRLVIAGFRQFTEGLEHWAEMLGIELKIITLDRRTSRQPESVSTGIEDFKRRGFSCLIGDTISVKMANRYGYRTVLIRSGKEALIQAIQEAERIELVRRMEIDRIQRIKCITDSAYEGIVSIDQEGIVRIFNPSAEKLLGLPAYEIIGKPILEVLPGMDLLGCLNSGERELGKVMKVLDHQIAVNMVPVRVEGEVTGVIATVQEVTGLIDIEQKIRRNLSARGLVADNHFKDILGDSSAIRRIKDEARIYAGVDSPIFIYGETGTGKELFAQAIHNASPRKLKPFVAFNCAALPEQLLESELFGYAEGAFTGASKGGKAGLFEQAHGGTIFLDEIGEISPGTQIRLLRVLEDKRIRRIGDDKVTPVDVRIIVATNEDLRKLVEEKKFRQDLFFRFNVLSLHLPPLRDRLEDIPVLIEFFQRKYNHRFGKMVKNIASEALAELGRYAWPGNVRQLENIIERLIIRSRRNTVSLSSVKEVLRGEPHFSEQHASIYNPEGQILNNGVISLPLGIRLSEMEKIIISRALDTVGGNKQEAAAQLGIGRTTLWRKLKQ
jgi:PAS domain S-box-containing protein